METTENKSIESIISEIVSQNPFLKIGLESLEKETLEYIFSSKHHQLYKNFFEIFQEYNRHCPNGQLKKGEPTIGMFKGINLDSPEASKIIASFMAIIEALNDQISMLRLEIIATKNTTINDMMTIRAN